MFKLSFETNVGASPFLLGMSRDALYSLFQSKPIVAGNQPSLDRFIDEGVHLGYDGMDRLIFLEITRPSSASVDGIDLLSTPIESIHASLATDGTYLDMFGTIVYLAYGVAISGLAEEVRSAALFKAGYYDPVIAKFGISRLSRSV